MAQMLWACPFCGHAATIADQDRKVDGQIIYIAGREGGRGLKWDFIRCPNAECQEFTISVSVFVTRRVGDHWGEFSTVGTWGLIPPSKAKVFPSYIPEAIRTDYTEACLVLQGSPKASATLARRCLQGMIRDYWGISKARLIDEIEAIKNKVDPLTWKAIDAVRSIGNIGAHMEKDINLIVDVDSGEAEALIGMIEMLLKEWYIYRHEREQQLTSVVAIATQKAAEKKASTATSSSTAVPEKA